MAESRDITTQYAAPDFVESCGAILFKSSTKQICLVYYHKNNEWLLPKGRRNVGESRIQAAIREAKEETGLPCRILPVNMFSRCTPNVLEEDEDTEDVPRLYESCSEPFMVTHRIVPSGGIKLIFWYIGEVDEASDLLTGESQFTSEFFPFKEAVEALKYAHDRRVVEKAIEIFESTDGPAP